MKKIEPIRHARQNELEQIIKRYLPLYVDKQFQSLKMLEAFPI